jgi:hypothetical protein
MEFVCLPRRGTFRPVANRAALGHVYILHAALLPSCYDPRDAFATRQPRAQQHTPYRYSDGLMA